MNDYRRKSAFGGMPTVVKNLLIINGLFFLATVSVKSLNLTELLGAFFWESRYFEPWQLITHMFMHGNLTHIFFNMFALWMFGTAIERIWGAKRFLIYYLITGLGAFALHYGIIAWEVAAIKDQLSPDMIEAVRLQGREALLTGRSWPYELMNELNYLYNIPVVGASGAVFGILLAFGMMFPNTPLIFIFFPVPIKAKYFVMLYGAFELFSGVANRPGDNVAHFAHLGGMLFGYILIKYWGVRSIN